jgi:lysine 2,3-aminomutase
MAGLRDQEFPFKLSGFLREKHRQLSRDPARSPDALRAIELQYLTDPRERHHRPGETRRHFEADLSPVFEGRPLRGVERLYRRSVVVEPTMVCAAHCRWCIRGQYEFFHLSEEELVRTARWLGSAPENSEVREVVVTGGDPLTNVRRLRLLVESLAELAPGVEIIRLGTRVPLQAPSLVAAPLLALLSDHVDRLEVGVHVNHAAELFPEVLAAMESIRQTGVRVYNQTVLLRHLNDDVEVLSSLAEALRSLRVETHYLFHCVPLRGMSHHRTTVARGLELARSLSASGGFSGRAKPTFTLMTDIGKITPYEGTILARQGSRLLLQSQYGLEERQRVNPAWSPPPSALVDDQGYLRVWYEDGSDEEPTGNAARAR